ncbi:MAG: cytochrome c [Kofleriaceae bacterium]
MGTGLRWIVLAALAGASATACDRRVAAGSVDGREIFATACATCHGADGAPPAAMIAQLGVRDLRSPQFRARVTAELVEQQVLRGSPNKLMPSFASALSAEQVRAVARFVAQELVRR